jgi:hypothetical protein
MTEVSQLAEAVQEATIKAGRRVVAKKLVAAEVAGTVLEAEVT